MKKNISKAVISMSIISAFTFTACGSASETADYTPSNGYDNSYSDNAAAPETVQDYYYNNAETIPIQDAAPDENYANGYIDEDAPVEEAIADEEESSAEDNCIAPEVPYYYNTEEYAEIVESGFKYTRENPLSTFSADVDTASYTNIRRMINSGYSAYDIPSDAVRIEEIMNYFDYDYPDAKGSEPFSVTAELADCPWNPEHDLMLVGIKAHEDTSMQNVPKNLVFLIDVSGSMYDSDKLPLVQQAFTMLSGQLSSEDRISIVTYAGSDAVLLDGESGRNTDTICDVINSLSAGGSTAGAAGIQTAYRLAEKNFIKGGNNRVILATDGDLNVGLSSVNELTELIEKERESGVFLSVLGFGEGNLKDNRLEALADNGNGNYSYIDSVSEAKKVLIDEMDATLVTVAKDVKFQVEFNPENVSGYRLIGYENRALADRDFNDDTKDAGEVGAGSTVTVLYELIPAYSKDDYVPTFRYSGNEPTESEAYNDAAEHSDELLTVSIRCKAPDSDVSDLYAYPVSKNIHSGSDMKKNLNFAACCAEFGMLLRGNASTADNISFDNILSLMRNYDYSSDEYKTEFEYLVRTLKNRS